MSGLLSNSSGRIRPVPNRQQIVGKFAVKPKRQSPVHGPKYPAHCKTRKTLSNLAVDIIRVACPASRTCSPALPRKPVRRRLDNRRAANGAATRRRRRLFERIAAIRQKRTRRRRHPAQAANMGRVLPPGRCLGRSAGGQGRGLISIASFRQLNRAFDKRIVWLLQQDYALPRLWFLDPA
jgi:hypothetical protein